MKEREQNIVNSKFRLAERLYDSSKERERILNVYENRCLNIPESADAAFVFGTSIRKFPDKFKKRVFTAVQLAKEGRVSGVIFSGERDNETEDIDQALDAKMLAISEFGLDEKKIWTVGGNNSNQNLELCSKLLTTFDEKIKDMYIVSSSEHLIRTIYLADRIFSGINVRCHPFPILNESVVDPNDPVVILEVVKTIIYNRVLNKNINPIDPDVKKEIDDKVDFYTSMTRARPQPEKTSFIEWRKELEKTEIKLPIFKNENISIVG